MEKFTGPSYRKFRGVRDRNMSAALALIRDSRSAAEYTGAALNATYSKFKGAAKIIGRIGGSTDRNGENWMQGKVCPGVPRFLRIAMQTPELNSAVIWLMQHGMESPEARKLIDRMERYAATAPEEGDQA